MKTTFYNRSASLLCTLYLVFSTIFLSAQERTYSTKSKKAIKAFEMGLKFYEGNKDQEATVYIDKAIQEDDNFIEAHILLADIRFDAKDYEGSLVEFKKVAFINPDFNPVMYYRMALANVKLEKYEDAYTAIEKFSTYKDVSPEIKKAAIQDYYSIRFAKEAIKNPVPFAPKNLGPEINTENPEYFPSITADNEMLLFTRRLVDKNNPTGFNEDFFYSKKENEKWSIAKNIGLPINTVYNEGAPTISVDGQTIIFTACELFEGDYGPKRKGLGSCDLFYTFLNGSKWTNPQNIGGAINSGNWESQPCFSSDGKTLYFVKGIRNQGNRQQDIYSAILQEDGSWSKATRLSDVINTKGREESVFIHPDGKTLYFASDGHPGFGGLDIFMSKLDENGEWGEPKNIGYPINTSKDENSLLVSSDGKLAYFASDREGGYGNLDLYSFELPQSIRPEIVTYLKGKVYNSKTKAPLEAKFELIDVKNGKTVIQSYSNTGSGDYLVSLPAGKEYALNVSKNGYLFYSENFVLTETKSLEPFVKDVPLDPIELNGKVILKNIFFETAKFNLKPESTVELNKLFAFLNLNATMKIEISGHTDNVGNKEANKVLSQNRAKAVYDFLITKGITADRMKYVGYGDTQPIASNDDEKGRAQNRRTEFKILEK